MDTKRSVSPGSRGGSVVVAEHSPPQSPLSGPDEGVSFSGKFHLPPGFRFHPTDQELVLYYLRRKICGLKIEFDVIAEINLYEFEPWDLPEISCLQTRDLEWYFFSPIDKKYPHGGRTNRSTCAGYWKATGKDREITSGSRIVGMKKTLVFYKGRAPKGERTDWVMREYRLTEKECERIHALQNAFVVCRVFKKSGPGPRNGEQYGAPVEDEEWESMPADGDDHHTSTANNKTDTGSNNDGNPQGGDSAGGNGSTSMNKMASCDATSNIRGCTTWKKSWVSAIETMSMSVGVEVSIMIASSCLEMQFRKCMVFSAICFLIRIVEASSCQVRDHKIKLDLTDLLFSTLNEEDGLTAQHAQVENARDSHKRLVKTSLHHQEVMEANSLEGLANITPMWALQIVLFSGYVEASFKNSWALRHNSFLKVHVR